MKAVLNDLRRWQAPVMGIIGLWLAVSPWVPGLGASEDALWGRLALGAALVAAAVAMASPAAACVGAWSGVAVGLVTIASPWLLDHGSSLAAAFNTVAVGAAATVLAFWVGLLETDQDGWWDDRGIAH